MRPRTPTDFLSKETPQTASGRTRILDDSPNPNVSPCIAPSQTVGGFSSSAAFSASAIPKMAQETIRLSDASTTSKCSATGWTKGAT